MKKVFQLTDPKKHADRVLEAIKHDIRKYIKREKRKDLADPETTYWGFDCKIGTTAEEAETVVHKELLERLESIQAGGATHVYVEIMAKAVPKPPKPIKEDAVEIASTEEAPAEDMANSEPTE